MKGNEISKQIIRSVINLHKNLESELLISMRDYLKIIFTGL